MAQKVASILAEIGIDSSKFTAGAKGAGSSISDLIGMVGNLNPALLGLSGELTAVAVYLESAEKAANESNIVMAKQEAILKATGYAANIAGFELQNMASELSRMTGIDDEAIQSAQSLMLTFRNIGRDEFPRAVAAAADLQTTFGSLESSTMQLGKALNDPLKGITALAKAGVTFSDTQKKQIQGFVDTNQLAKAQAIILSEVEAQVGGTAKAIEDASDGSNRLKVSSENLSEAIGNSLTPATRAWNNMLADTYDNLTANIEASNRYAAALQVVYKQTEDNVRTHKDLKRGRSELNDATKELVNEELRSVEYGRAWESALRDQGIQFEGNTSRIKDNTASIQENEEAMSKANEATLKGVEQWGDMEESHNSKLEGLYARRKDLEADYAKAKAQGYAETSDQIQGVLGKMADVDAAIQNEKKQYEIKTKAVVLGYIEQKLAADGVLDDKETEWLLKKGIEWGVYEKSAYDAYTTAKAEANGYFDTIKNGPSEEVVTVTTRYVNDYGQREVGASPGRATGGPASGFTWVGEAGPELVNLPAGSFVNNNNTSRQMTAPNETRTDNTDALIAAINASRVDPSAIARALVTEMQRAGIGQ